MEKISVKKPFTVLVAVIIVLVLGFVSVTRMTTELLPPVSLPYLMVVTPYPGASPEQVEHDVIRPQESALGTVSGVENVYATSGENFGLVQLEFADGTDMDSTLVKVTTALQQVSASLPEMCGTPSVIEISMDMMATMYVSVSRDQSDIYQLSSFVSDKVQPYLERQNGVASVAPLGLVQQSIQLELDGGKIDALNDKILAGVNKTLADALEGLEKAEKEVASGKEELKKSQAAFGQTMAQSIFDKLDQNILKAAKDLKKEVDSLLTDLKKLRQEITDGKTGKALDEIIKNLEDISGILEKDHISAEDLLSVSGNLRVILHNIHKLSESLQQEAPPQTPAESLNKIRALLKSITDALDKISGALDSMPGILSGLQDAYAGMTQAQLEAAVGFAAAGNKLSAAETQLADARTKYEASKAQALAGADVSKLLSIDSLSKLIYAQNFSMPAGYIDDKNDNSWLLTVGDSIKSVEELSEILLVSMEPIGNVRIKDVAAVTMIDNAGLSYTRLNGQQAVILSIFKGSTAGTNATTQNCLNAFQDLEKKYPGTHVVTLMNQGSYIDLIIESILTSMLSGAALAIIILALFLKDFKPTLVVAVSIPLSVMFTLVLMYFTNVQLNMMTLCGLALGIGMLVDNSIVVMENIYRLRNRGVSAARAAVQGTKQVAGAIIASTLTTICVFLPLVFTTGLIREMMLPLGLCIGYCLMASLLTALTVVPASASTILRHSRPKSHPLFEKFLHSYGRGLNWCLDHKAVPILIAVVLLAGSIFAVARMGIVMLPEMTGDQIQVKITTPEGLTRSESYEMADEVIQTLLKVDGVEHVGVMDAASTTGLLGAGLQSTKFTGKYLCYAVVPKDTPASKVQEISDRINEAAESLPCQVEASAGGMDDMTAMFGKGLSIHIYGEDLEILRELSEKVTEVVKTVPGYTDVVTSFTDGEPTIHLSIDKSKAMEKGLTVAQVYMAISEKMKTSSTATKITVDGIAMDVKVENLSDPLTADNLMDLELEGISTDSTGKQVKTRCKLSEIAETRETTSMGAINRENQTRYATVSAGIADGQNATLLARDLEKKLTDFTASASLPYGYSVEIAGESTMVNEMIKQMTLLLGLGLLLIYLVMVAQFQSLLSPFIVMFTVPLAFTGGMIGLLVSGQQLNMLSLMGFAVLMGTVVNNGIVFVDYVNQLRIGGMDRRSALIATGKTRMRPIFMTALTTILAMFLMIFSDDMAGQLGGGMAIVIVGGMLYGTLMTLIIVPVVYDFLFRKQPLNVDIGSENLDDIPDDAAEFIAQALKNGENQDSESCEISTPQADSNEDDHADS